MSNIDQIKAGVRESAELSRLGEYDMALTVLDEAIEVAISGNLSLGVTILSRHAAVLSTAQDDPRSARHYYELLLRHAPDDTSALYGLSELLLKQGRTEEATAYAARCYDLSIQRGGDLGQAMIDLLLKEWPEIGQRYLAQSEEIDGT